ncbi:MAG: S9 family peptidase [Acidobacteria bacterium]|nr:S9 family peptidase [Acidobacteriota bacterium]MBI3422547.1 S9 family peptidase [Acidobacteriota bacterium]
MTRSRFVSSILLALLFVAPALSQNKPRLLDKETFMDMESVGSPNIAPDGKTILFTRTWVDKVKDQSRSNLWITDTDGTRVRELTSGARNDSAPEWSPDGKRIAFLSDRDGTNQLHVLWLDTREIAQLTHLEQAPSNTKWSPDGKWLAFTAFVPDTDPILNIRLPERPRGAEWARPAVLVDRLSWAADGRGPTPKGNIHVFVIDAALGGTPRQITSGKFSHNGFDWSPDGKTIYVSGIRKPDAEYTRNDSEIYAVDVGTLDIKPLTDRKGPDSNPNVSPDGKLVAYIGYDEKNYTNHVSSLYLMNNDGTNKRMIAGNLDSTPQNIGWWAASNGLYFTVESKGKTDICWLSLADGAVKKVSTGTHLAGFSVANNGQIAAISSTLKEPNTLVTFKSDDVTKLNKLVDVNKDVLAGVKLGEPEELWFTSKDGLKVQGWLIKPANYEAGKKYPLVLWIHGGPWSMYSTAWSWSFQNFAAQGYAVLFTNPRGSTGYGQDFVNGIQYSYPGKDYDDLMAGVDAALAKGFIDERNLFVCGGSGGGVLTAWIVGHTERFAAAVSMRPVIDWHSFVGTTDGASWYYQFDKYPWEDPMQYAVRSPLHYVANVKTPTMVMTGEADLRTPMGQSEEFYRALKMLKKETLLVRMPEEFHGWRRPSHQIAQQLYLMAWFEKHMRKEQAAGR